MTAKVPLKIAVATSGHTAALKDGTVPIEGVEADFVEVVPIIAAFRRMVRDRCDLLCAAERPWSSLPLFR